MTIPRMSLTVMMSMTEILTGIGRAPLMTKSSRKTSTGPTTKPKRRDHGTSIKRRNIFVQLDTATDRIGDSIQGAPLLKCASMLKNK